MTDELERLKARNEHCAQWAVGEVESLRQRVKELEALRVCADHDANELAEELAALKQGQGEPVAWASVRISDGSIWELNMNDPTANIAWWETQNKHAAGWLKAIPLYTSAPSIPEGWQLVPIEPTPEMITAGTPETEGHHSLPFSLWKAMLLAAPKHTK